MYLVIIPIATEDISEYFYKLPLCHCIYSIICLSLFQFITVDNNTSGECKGKQSAKKQSEDLNCRI